MYKPTIGLEIHAELSTNSKMFCSCKNAPDEKIPNNNICPICLGHPGTLPVINEMAIKKAVKTGLALNCAIEKISYFERKNYFYPDLPKGYQISQYKTPLAQNGYLEIPVSNSVLKKIRIQRVHMEEDTGKLIHPENADYSLIDFNRAGIPLMEIVTEPDIESGQEAREFARHLQLILRYLNVSEANMEKGEMRIEVNISVSNESRITSNESRIEPRITSNESRMNNSRIMLKNESYRLMSLLFEIHNKLGSIYKEKNYQNAVEEIFKRENIPYQREKNIKLKFENLEISDFFADFVIDNKILLEIKAKSFIAQDDIRQVSRYIKSLNLPLGIVVNFKRQKLEFKRIVNPAFENDSSLFEENSRNILSLFEENSRNILGTKVEVKNLNSLKVVEKAIEYEIKRQKEILEKGEKVIQETRGWHDKKEITISQREKEQAHDYRYFPEPDLPPLELSSEFLEDIKKEIIELPLAKMERFKKEYYLLEKEAEIYVWQKELGNYFEKSALKLNEWLKTKKGIENTTEAEETAKAEKTAEAEDKEMAKAEETARQELKKIYKIASNYISTDLQGLLQGKTIEDKPLTFFSGKKVRGSITPQNFAEFIKMIYSNEISSKIAKTLLKEMYETGNAPAQIIEKKGLKLISDENELEKIVTEIISKNQKAADDYKQGKSSALQFLIGQIMSQTKGKANLEKTIELLKKLLCEN